MKKLLFLCCCLIGGLFYANGQYNVGGTTVALGGECFRLTTATNSQAGSLWFQNKISLGSDLTINATINLGTDDVNGADGIAFVLQPVCNGIGGIGGGIGYAGINPSVAVEFDTWNNNGNIDPGSGFNINDPADDHVGLNRNGLLYHSGPSVGAINTFQTYVTTGNLENGANHPVKIEWIALTQNLKVTLDNVLIVNYFGDIVTNTFGGNRNVFWGFTAATGAADNNQSVCIINKSFTEEGSYIVTKPTCPNFNNGAIDFNPAGGIGTPTYSWSNGAVTEDISGITAGNYSVTVTDGNGCASKYSIPVANEIDTTPPVIACPANITQSNDPNVCGAEVCYSLPTVTEACAPSTPIGYTFKTKIGNSYYYQSNSLMNYVTAKNSATAAGGHLAVITSAAENAAVTASGAGFAWMGGNDTETEGTFKWDNCEPLFYVNWCGGEPNGNTTENYFEFESGGCWNDLSASAGRFALLEIEGAKLVQTAGLPPNSLFPIGTTTNTFVATDAAGNTASCSFTVTVNDTQKPSLVGVPDDATVECNAVPTGDAGVTSNDNCTVTTSNYYVTPSIKAKLLHHWKADGDFTDAIGTANGTPIGTVSFGPGIIGTNGFKFDGSNSVVTTGTSGSLSGTGNFSVSAWIKTTSTSSMVIVGQRMAGPIDGEYLFKIGGNHNNGVLKPGKLYFLAFGTGSPVVDLFSTKSVNDGYWHQVIAERNGANIRLYIDGVLDVSGSTTVTVSFNPVIVTSIGKDVRDNNSFFNGMIDDVKVWSGNICENTYEFDRVWTATDASGNQSAAIQHVKVQDTTPPVLNCPANITVGNDANICGAIVNYTATATDNCGSATVVYSIASGSLFSIGPTTVNVTATDACGLTRTCSFTVTVTNQLPVVASVAGPAAPLALGSVTNATITFTDNNVTNAAINWDDGSGLQNITNPVSPLTVSHTYATPGVYSIFVTLTDACGKVSATYEYQFVVIFDPSGGFITGGGWINSPAGAYLANPLLTGRANFGFVAKYKKGSNVPDGNTEFQYKTGNINFSSSLYDEGRLVISGAKASFKGVGTINGSGNFGFLITAIDGQVSGGGGIDKFRMKIWDKNNSNAIVYDNNLGVDENDVPTTALAGGSIVIHDNGKGREGVDEIIDSESNDLSVKVSSNPTSKQFGLLIQSSVNKAVSIKILNQTGILIETLSEIPLNTEIKIGENYHFGLYYVEVQQGSKRKIVKLMKLN
jgi:Bacterial lectin/Concanavalin A-like lectin/glucanases superfamily/HYR domain/PKD domain/Lectin C-type domain